MGVVALLATVASGDRWSPETSTSTLLPTADTYVQADAPTSNFGSSPRWSVEGRETVWREALLRFEVPVPPGREVVSATLRAHSEAAAPDTEFVEVRTTRGDWVESEVTWETAPEPGALVGEVGGFSSGSWVEWDVTAGVPAAGGQVDLLLMTSARRWLGFPSRDHPSVALRPGLVVATAPVGSRTVPPLPPPVDVPASVRLPEVSTGPAGTEDVTIAAVGDMNPPRNTSPDSASGRNAARITAGLEDGSLDHFVGLGDFQYTEGTCTALTSYWAELWGAAIAQTYWTAGPNHDVEPGRNDDLDRFMNGECPGSSTVSATNRSLGGFVDALDFYSFDVGAWHIAVLPAAAWRYDRAAAEAMTERIDADLAAAAEAGRHLAAVYHEPYFTSETSAHDRYDAIKPWIDVLWEHRVRFTLSGSQHNYERSCPVDNADRCVPDGMVAFQVSTGGIDLREFTSRPDYVAERFDDTWGYLELTLQADGSFTWQFRPTSGGMRTDSGTRAAEPAE
ncbi:hypothetical protein SAMN05660464_2146 [Geodermatophilus dictyosporus]|uniref:Carbohydrate-binding module family 96 domain-containing protein n=1 Tax=Geodermatophilus dictyosporus TaxID=1523247 RepID=A0A1I5MU83_9ACTN|nr:hypothetical protein SAMN05660464_2146 [Geodermatophilus dictyosporus]